MGFTALKFLGLVLIVYGVAIGPFVIVHGVAILLVAMLLDWREPSGGSGTLPPWT